MNRTASSAALLGLCLAILSGLSVPVTAGENVYIPLGSADQVVIIDTQQKRIVGKIDGLPAVHGLAATPDRKFLIAGSFEEREEDGSPPAKPEAVTEDKHAAHHAKPSKDRRETAPAVSTVSIVDIQNRSVVRRVDVPGAVHHVATSPDGRLAVVTHPNEGAISAIDLKTFEVVATIATGDLPNYAVFNPNGRHIYVSNAGSNTISVVDARGWRRLHDIKVGESPEHVVLSMDGETLYVNNIDDGTVSVVALAAATVEETIYAGSVLHGIDLSDDERTLFVAALGDDKVVAINLKGKGTRNVSLSPSPYHLASVRGTGKLLISSSDEPKVWVIDQATLSVLGEIAIGGKGHQMVMLSGGDD